MNVAALTVTIDRLAMEPDSLALVAGTAQGLGGLVTVSGRPSLSLQGTVGVIGELIVRAELGGRGIGTRLLHEVTAFAAERGFVRLEIALPSDADDDTRNFLRRATFEPADEQTYRWSPLEAQHAPRLPGVSADAVRRALP